MANQMKILWKRTHDHSLISGMGSDVLVGGAGIDNLKAVRHEAANDVVGRLAA